MRSSKSKRLRLTTRSTKNDQNEARKTPYIAVTNGLNTAAALDIFQMGQPIILGQDLNFFLSYCMAKYEG